MDRERRVFLGAMPCSTSMRPEQGAPVDLHYPAMHGMLIRDFGGRQEHAAGHPEPAQGRSRVGPGAAYACDLLHTGRGRELQLEQCSA